MTKLLLIAMLLGANCSARDADVSWFAFEGPRQCSIPFSVGRPGYKVWIDVVIAGEKHRAMVDTGGTTTVSLRLARRLGLNLVPTDDRPVGLSGELGRHWTTTAALQVGGMKLTGYPLHCIDLTSFHDSVAKNGGEDFDVIVGADLLSVLRADLDFDKSKLALKRPTNLVPPESKKSR